MEKLLQWSIAGANGDKDTLNKIGGPDNKAIAELLGMAGPDEPTLMVEAMRVITNPEAELEAKEIAFDNFEMLSENLDNANNIENLKLWEPLVEQLKAEEELLQRYAASVIGTATQNNQKTQEDLLKYQHSMDYLLNILNDQQAGEPLKMKCLYALSNFIRHNEKGYTLFKEKNGWHVIDKVVSGKQLSAKFNLRLSSLMTSIMSTGPSDEKKTHIEKLFPNEKAQEILKSYEH